MAAVTVTHSKVVTIPDDPNYPVGSNEWNDNHVVLGLDNVDNTSDANKPVSTAQASALALKADLAGPAFTGAPTAITPPNGNNTARLATTAFVANATATLAPLASPAFTGTITVTGSTGEVLSIGGNFNRFFLAPSANVPLQFLNFSGAGTGNRLFMTDGQVSLYTAGLARFSVGVLASDTVSASPDGTNTSWAVSASDVMQMPHDNIILARAASGYMPGLTWKLTDTLGGLDKPYGNIGVNTADANKFRVSAGPTAANIPANNSLILSTYNGTTEVERVVIPGGAGGQIVITGGGGLTVSGGATLNSHATAGMGYGTGAGGAVTQATSRATGVTLNKPSGAITLFSAAGSATAASFTVTNSTVAATDTISLSVKSGTNKYNAFVTAVAAGSFEITFNTTGGTSVDAPVINFNVIKGVTA